MIQTRENGKKTNFGPSFAPPNFFRKDLAPSYHPMQFKGKPINQT